MILQILKAKWKVVAAIIGVALLALIVYGKWDNYGKEKYHSGYLAAVEAQKVKDKEASEQHEQDKKTIEQEAQNRIDAARADASAAAVKSGSVFKPCEGSGSPAPARTDGAGKPESPAGGEGTVPTPRSVAIGEPEVATVLGWYAYAETCNAWATFK